uniref:Smr domain-containing protein n=1 Tax=Ananas comosus var. bracteatus TaxID=296719 RepID=A0A6V7QD14_ANACO|nr:unnamed protein product [Ananas comosus var. bracteatus]
MSAFFSPTPSPPACIAAASGSSGRKSADRLLSSLSAAADSAAADRLVRRLVASSSKSAALAALSNLLSLSSPLAPRLQWRMTVINFDIGAYARIRETSWFSWNSKLTADVAALLEQLGQCFDAEHLVSSSISTIRSPRDLTRFYCDLIESYSGRGLRQKVVDICSSLRNLPFSGRKPYESMIKGFCLLDMPEEAEAKLQEMALLGLKPSAFEFRLIAQSYGRPGSFSEMKRVIGLMEDAGFSVDTICANVVLSCYGDRGELPEMVEWLKRMRELGIDFSVRTFNTLLDKLESESASVVEAALIRELVDSALLVEMLEWSPAEGKLDLHGFHATSAFVIMLQLVDELRSRLSAENAVVPAEISVVCGSGKHSDVRGRSPVKMVVSEMLFRMNSAMRLDRKNSGRFVGRGKAVKEWLC